jgi:hypothetical protein
MLRNTLILPSTDAGLAARLFQEAIEDLDVVLMLIVGEGPRIEQLVAWADQLANKTMAMSVNVRRVVWIRDPHAIAEQLSALLGSDPLPTITVLNFHDQVKDRLVDDGQNLVPLMLERSFLRGFEL